MTARLGWRGYIRASDEKPTINKELIKRVIQYAKPYRWQIIGSLIAILFYSLFNLVNPLILRELIDVAIPEKRINYLILCAAGLLIIPILSGVCQIIERRFSAQVGEGIIFDLRMALYSHLQYMSLRFYTHTQVGELISRLNSDVVDAQNAINRTLVSMVTNFINVVSVLIVMTMLEWRLTLISAVIVPAFILAARKLGSVFRTIARKQMVVNARMNATLGETLTIGGALLVKLFGRQKKEIDKFSSRAREVFDLGIQRATLARAFIVVVGLLTAIGTSLVYGLGGYMVIINLFTLGTVVAFGNYLTHLYHSFQSLINAPVEFSTSLVSFERVFEILDLPKDIVETDKPTLISKVYGALVFENVSFKYRSDSEGLLHEVKRPTSTEQAMEEIISESLNEFDFPDYDIPSQAREMALEDIKVAIEPGQLVALVGPSGAGKTTLTYLIPRLYDPTEGVVLLDGIDIKEILFEDLAKTVGMVTQESYLFHDTILANLIYGNPDATREEVESASKTANIHDFIVGLPDGYLTVVGERGYRLSGGEKQRLSLARVLLKDPKILILDEATSHLDSESEALIQEAMSRVLSSRTSIVIAHRLSTILSADLILVMDRGKIVERGNHQTLLAMNGLYAHLYKTQFESQLRMRNI